MLQASEEVWHGWDATREVTFCSELVFLLNIYLQATLEIEFFHQTASRYVTETAEKRLAEVYTKISQAYVRRPGDDMKSQLEGVKKTLAETRRATQLEFLCFKKEKDRSASSRPTMGTGRPPPTPVSTTNPPLPDVSLSGRRDGRDSERLRDDGRGEVRERDRRRRPLPQSPRVDTTPSSSDNRF